jgi:hypothetical protein
LFWMLVKKRMLLLACMCCACPCVTVVQCVGVPLLGVPQIFGNVVSTAIWKEDA